MKRALYLSQTNQSFSDDELINLADMSAEKNHRLDVTGFLCFSSNNFFQYIEGDNDTIDGLISTIRNDNRHKFITQIETENNTKRLFSSWPMRYLSSNDLSELNLENYVSHNLLYLNNSNADKHRGLRLLWNQIGLISLHHDMQMIQS